MTCLPHTRAPLLSTRLNRIVRLAEKIPSNHPVGLVRWFGSAFAPNGKLAGLEYDPTMATSEGRMQIRGKTGSHHFLLSSDILRLFENFVNETKLSKEELDYAIDDFLVHEIVHQAQGMAGGNHRNLWAIAPNVLAALDYEADACAILVLMTLWFVELFEVTKDAKSLNSNSQSEATWIQYAKLIEATLHQVHIFSLMTSREQPTTLKSALRRSIPLLRWERSCAWHFQYHRVLHFHPALSVADFQVLFRPIIGFRNQELAESAALLTHSWPKVERSRAAEMPVDPVRTASMAISGPGYNGARYHAQIFPKDPTRYDALFEAVFRCDVSLSEGLFDEVLDQYPIFCGPKPPPPPSDPPTAERWEWIQETKLANVLLWEFKSSSGTPAVEAAFRPGAQVGDVAKAHTPEARR